MGRRIFGQIFTFKTVKVVAMEYNHKFENLKIAYSFNLVGSKLKYVN